MTSSVTDENKTSSLNFSCILLPFSLTLSLLLFSLFQCSSLLFLALAPFVSSYKLVGGISKWVFRLQFDLQVSSIRTSEFLVVVSVEEKGKT